MSVTAEIIDLVNKNISDNRVMVFSKTHCPYSQRAKALFEKLNVEYKVIELDERLDGDSIQKALAQLTQQRTVPNIFINKQHIGGCDALFASFESGRLTTILKEANIKANL